MEERLVFTETGLIRGDGRHLPGTVLKDLIRSFDDTLYQETAKGDRLDFERRRRVFFKRSILSDDQASSLVEEYFDMATMVLDAFIPKDCKFPLATKFFGALDMVMDVSLQFFLSSYIMLISCSVKLTVASTLRERMWARLWM